MVEQVIDIFRMISKVPRPSGKEEQIQKALVNWAKENNLNVITREGSFNVIIQSSPSPGYESAPTLVLQGHMDMVCEKEPGVEHDFLKDPIELVETGGWLTAKGTTLGADNGVGVAIALALASDKSLPKPPLEILITANEESGMTGAKELSTDLISGRMLINIDSEGDDTFNIGCAGGADAHITFPVKRVDSPCPSFYELKVEGLKGGHSGADIHRQRANALLTLARVVDSLTSEFKCAVASFASPCAFNVIPREAVAHITVSHEEKEKVDASLKEWEAKLQSEYMEAEGGLVLSIHPSEAPPFSTVLDEASLKKLLNLLLALPNGVASFDASMGIVRTSNNVAFIKTEESSINIGGSQRSSSATELAALNRKIVAIANLAETHIGITDKYPGWEPNRESKLLKKCEKIYKKISGENPHITAIHAGLECGLILEKFSAMEAISIGPIIEGAHTPDEKVSINSISKICLFLKELLHSMKE